MSEPNSPTPPDLAALADEVLERHVQVNPRPDGTGGYCPYCVSGFLFPCSPARLARAAKEQAAPKIETIPDEQYAKGECCPCCSQLSRATERAEAAEAAKTVLHSHLDRLGHEVTGLKRDLDSAQADVRRLDWLCQHDASILRGGIIERRKGNDPTAYHVEWIDAGGGINNQSERFSDYRAAIDSARGKEEGDG